MFTLIRYLKDYKKETILGPLFKMLEASFELIVPLIMAQIIDIGIQRGEMSYIWQRGGVLVLLGILGLICSLIAQYYAAKASFAFGTELRKDLFAHIGTLSYDQLDKLGTSQLITSITTDINHAQSGVNLVLRLFLRSPFIIIGALIMAFVVNIRVAWIFLAIVPVLAIIIYSTMVISIPLFKKSQKQLNQVLETTRENLLGIRVIRAFSKQKEELKVFEQHTKRLKKIQLLANNISALLNPMTYIFVNIAVVLIIWYGGHQVDQGVITTGEVIALVNYMTQILIALVALATLIASVTRAQASAIRINEILAQKPSMTDENNQNQVALTGGYKIVFSKVTFSYSSASDHRVEPSLENITFAAKKGDTIGIIGGTGSGKSTLVNLLSRFYDVTKGQILVDGIDVRKYPFKQLRDKIGTVPQKAVLFKGTIRENMQYRQKDATDEEIYHALEIAQALDVVKSKANGLDEVLQQGGTNLSGGQRQRLTIARALVGQPEILVLDDSASALDLTTDANLRKSIKENVGEMTVLVISQRATTIKNADYIIVLDDGKMVGYGNHDELLENCEIYREICLSQLSSEEVNKS